MSAPPALPVPLPPDVDRSIVLNGTALGLLIPAVLVVIVRVAVRAFMTKNIGWDDWLMIIATPLLVANQATSIVSTRYGIGRHIFYLKPEDAAMAMKYNTIAQPMNILGLFFLKASIVALLIRIKVRMRYKVILYITLALNFAITVAGLVIAFAQCQPFEKNWFVDMPGTCWPRDAFTIALYALQGITIATDICYITIPILHLWNVQMAVGTKLGIIGAIAMGAISMVCSIVAIPFVYTLGGSIDVTWNIIDLAAIKIGEVNVAMIVGCLPAMQPLFKKVSKTAFMSIGSNSKTGSNNTSDEERLMRLKLKPSQYEALSGKKSQPMSQDFGPGYNAYGEPYGASANRNSLPQDPAHW